MTGPGPRSPESEPEVGPGPGERERRSEVSCEDRETRGGGQDNGSDHGDRVIGSLFCFDTDRSFTQVYYEKLSLTIRETFRCLSILILNIPILIKRSGNHGVTLTLYCVQNYLISMLAR